MDFPPQQCEVQTFGRSNSFGEEHKPQVLLWRSSCCGRGSCGLLGIDLYTEAPGYLLLFCPPGSFRRHFCLDYCYWPRTITALVISKWSCCALWRQNRSLAFIFHLLVPGAVCSRQRGSSVEPSNFAPACSRLVRTIIFLFCKPFAVSQGHAFMFFFVMSALPILSHCKLKQHLSLWLLETF